MSDPVGRKLTTIFCADVHGYSRLMDADEVGTLQTLKLYRQAMTGLIERHDGRLRHRRGQRCRRVRQRRRGSSVCRRGPA